MSNQTICQIQGFRCKVERFADPTSLFKEAGEDRNIREPKDLSTQKSQMRNEINHKL